MEYQDTGLSVRKRVIKLLKSFYLITDDARRIDIATRMVLRMLDEDDTVKDLAIKTIEELWFPPQPLASAMKGRSAAPGNNAHDNTALLSKVSVIMGTSAQFKDRQSPLEDVLHKIMREKEGKEKDSLHSRYGEICEALIDGLVDASDLPGFVSLQLTKSSFSLTGDHQTVINCIRTIYLLTSAYPSILSGTNASTLLPYLKNANSVSTTRLDQLTEPNRFAEGRRTVDLGLSAENIQSVYSSHAQNGGEVRPRAAGCASTDDH